MERRLLNNQLSHLIGDIKFPLLNLPGVYFKVSYLEYVYAMAKLSFDKSYFLIIHSEKLVIYGSSVPQSKMYSAEMSIR